MLVLPEKMREEVRKPFGKIYKGAAVAKQCKEAERPLITVSEIWEYFNGLIGPISKVAKILADNRKK